MNTYNESTQQDQGLGRERSSAPREGRIARRIERQTAKLPSDLFLWAAGSAMIASLAFELIGISRRGPRARMRDVFGQAPKAPMSIAGFVGQWVPSLLLLGVYNKIVKVAGSDRTEQ